MNERNNKMAEKSLSSLLSAVEKQSAVPDRQFLDKLQERTTAEFLASSANGAKKSQIKTSFPIWRVIMKSNITKFATAAAVVIGTIGLYFFFGNGQSTLYAQVMKSFEQARTIYAVGYSFEDGKKTKANELWYQQGIGLRMEGIRNGKNHIRLDNGRYEWEYLQGNDFAVQSESTQKMRLPGELTEISRYLKDCVREPDNDIEIDGFPCKLYVNTHPAKDNHPAVKSMMWIDEQMRFRQYEEQKLINGIWQTIEFASISYNLPLESGLFTADFGPGIEVIRPEDTVKNIFPLGDAIATKEVMGLVFAVHELKRNGNYIFTVCSIRPTQETREQIHNYRPQDDTPDYKHYGDIFLASWWQRKENGDLEERPYTHTMLGSFQVDDVLVRYFASLPKGQWPGVNDEFELSAGISPLGKLRELLREKGQGGRPEIFRPLFTLSLPAEDTPVNEIAANLYGTAKLIAPFKPMRLEPRPTDITMEEFASETEQKILGLRPMNEIWESVGSEVAVQLLDEDGRPVSGARLGSDIRNHDGQLFWYYQNERRDCAVSDADGKVVLQGQQMFGPGASRQNSCMLFAIQQEKQLAGVATITDKDFGTNIVLTMRPACRVHGRFTCPELSDKEDALNQSVDTYLYYFGEDMMHRVLCHSTNKQEFEALLVPGEYEVNHQTYDINKKWIARAGRLLDVPEGERELDLGEIVLKLEDYK